MTDPLAPPPATRNPDTVFLIALCLVAGLSQVLSGTEPGTVDALVPTWMALTWGIALIVGATLILVGVFWPQQGTGQLIELVGRSIYGPAALAYAVAIYAAADKGFMVAALGAAPFVGFAVACLVRVWQIVRRAEHSLKQMRERSDP